MIRYPTPAKKKFAAEIEATAPGWLAKAKLRTAAYKQAKAYSEPPLPSWSMSTSGRGIPL